VDRGPIVRLGIPRPPLSAPAASSPAVVLHWLTSYLVEGEDKPAKPWTHLDACRFIFIRQLRERGVFSDWDGA
jgi:hypothetical protein